MTNRRPSVSFVGVRSRPPTTSRRKRFDDRTLIAHHEAGHAVLSAAINDAPKVVSIRPLEHTLGRSEQKMIGRLTSLVQVYLAGFAAQHLLTGRRPRQLDQEVGFAILARSAPDLRTAFIGFEDRDGTRAVEAVLRMGCPDTIDRIKDEIARFYQVTRLSLRAVWPAVVAVAEALLEREELDRDQMDEALADADIHSPIFRVHMAHGLCAAT